MNLIIQDKWITSESVKGTGRYDFSFDGHNARKMAEELKALQRIATKMLGVLEVNSFEEH